MPDNTKSDDSVLESVPEYHGLEEDEEFSLETPPGPEWKPVLPPCSLELWQIQIILRAAWGPLEATFHVESRIGLSLSIQLPREGNNRIVLFSTTRDDEIGFDNFRKEVEEFYNSQRKLYEFWERLKEN